MNQFSECKIKKDKMSLYLNERYEDIKGIATIHYCHVTNKVVYSIEDLAHEAICIILELPDSLNQPNLINYAMKLAYLKINRE